MFRGFTHREHITVLAILVLWSAGLAVGSLRQRQETQLPIWREQRTDHSPQVDDSASFSQPPQIPRPQNDEWRIDLNAADAAILEGLPGIGPQKAQDIVTYRTENGPFRSVDDFESVPGIGPKTLERLRPHLRVVQIPGEIPPRALLQRSPGSFSPYRPLSLGVVASPPVQIQRSLSGRVSLNSASAEELQSLQGIGPKLAERIIENRRIYGPFHSIEDLQRVSGIGPKTLESNRSRLAL